MTKLLKGCLVLCLALFIICLPQQQTQVCAEITTSPLKIPSGTLETVRSKMPTKSSGVGQSETFREMTPNLILRVLASKYNIDPESVYYHRLRALAAHVGTAPSSSYSHQESYLTPFTDMYGSFPMWGQFSKSEGHAFEPFAQLPWQKNNSSAMYVSTCGLYVISSIASAVTGRYINPAEVVLVCIYNVGTGFAWENGIYHFRPAKVLEWLTGMNFQSDISDKRAMPAQGDSERAYINDELDKGNILFSSIHNTSITTRGHYIIIYGKTEIAGKTLYYVTHSTEWYKAGVANGLVNMMSYEQLLDNIPGGMPNYYNSIIYPKQ